MNIAFFGTSDRSIPILEGLKNSDFNIVLIVTKEDVRVGRKQELKPTAVKTWAQDNGVQFVTTKSLDTETTLQITNSISKNNIELGVVADFSFMIPEKIINTPRLGVINIHFSLLPRYRGAAPVQHAILNLDEKTGITYQKMAKKMDMGDIIHQTEYLMNGKETSGELYSTLFDVAGSEISDVLEKYVSGEYKPFKQDESKATYTYSPSHPKHTFIFKEDAKIDWSKSLEKIDAAVRAYDPWPVAWTTLGEFSKHFAKIKQDKDLNLKVKIYETTLNRHENGDMELKIEKIQVEGKRVLNWDEFSNGYLA